MNIEKRIEKIKLSNHSDFERYIGYSSIGLSAFVNITNMIAIKPELARYFNKETIASNLWAINEIDGIFGYTEINRYVIIGGGCGLLASLIFSYVNLISNQTMTPVILSIDKDEQKSQFSKIVNSFQHFSGDYISIVNEVDDPKMYYGFQNKMENQLLINNVAHRFQDIDKWIKKIGKGVNVCLLGKELLFPESSLTEIYYQGVMMLPDYSRYLVVGKT